MGEESLPTTFSESGAGVLAVYVDASGGVSMPVPAIIADAGERVAHATLEFFTARIPNAHTRRAYGRAVFAFCGWCARARVSLAGPTAPTVSAYLAGLRDGSDGLSLASIKLTASAIRHWLDFLTERGVLGAIADHRIHPRFQAQSPRPCRARRDRDNALRRHRFQLC